MKFLFDILHPAHVHFFRNAIAELKGAGYRVLVTSREKDITHRLLDLYRIPYVCISKEAKTKTGLLKELLSRNRKMIQMVKKERPDILTSIGGISTAQVGFLTQTRNLIFYDTENAFISNLLSYPFATEVITPDCYRGKVLGRHVTYPGYHELAYLHPKRFTLAKEALTGHGVDTDEPYSVVRFVSWKALHDVKARGFTQEEKIELIKTLKEYGKVYITSESCLLEEFEHYRLPIPPDQVHHLLACARLFIGESATMASESAILGTPFIYLDPVGRGYTDELERRFGLGFNFRPWQAREAIAQAKKVLSGSLKYDQDFQNRGSWMLKEKIDVTDFVVQRLLNKG